MTSVRISLRIILIVIHIFSGMLQMLLFSGLVRMTPQNIFFRRLMARWHSGLCSILGVKVTVYGAPDPEALLIVSNHISWLDISVYGQVLTPIFLSKAAVKKWPIVGWLANAADTLYIQRGKSGESHLVRRDMAEKLEQGQSVIFFPEATTTDGTTIKKFHPRLFESALDAEVAVQPVAVCYPHILGVNPAVPYIGDMTLLNSVWRLLAQKEVIVTVHILEKIPHVNQSRETLAKQASAVIKKQVERCHRVSH